MSCTGRRSGSSAGRTRSSWARTTPGAGSAVRWCTTRDTPRGSTRATSPPSPTTGSARTGLSATRMCVATMSGWRPSCRWPGRTGRGATRTATRSPRTPSPAPRRSCGRGRSASASRCGSARSGSSTAPSATGRTASTAATASRAARSTRRPARMSPIYPTRWPTGWRCGRTPWPCGWRSTTPPAGRWVWPITTRSAARSACSGPGSWRSRVTRSRRPGCCWPRPAAGSPTGWATARTRSGAT